MIEKLIEDIYFRNNEEKFANLKTKYEWILFLILAAITFPFSLFSSTKKLKSILTSFSSIFFFFCNFFGYSINL